MTEDLLFADWNGRRVVVTGANGFVGSHLVRALVANGASVTIVVRPTADLWRLADVLSSIRTVRGELEAFAQPDVRSQVGSAEVVYHLAAAGTVQSDRNAWAMIQVNVVGTWHVLNWAAEIGARRLVCAGTGFEYGIVTSAAETTALRPMTAYAATKAAASLIAHSCGPRSELSVVTLRTFSVYGPGQSRDFVIPYAIARAITGSPIHLTGGRQTRDFVHVDDAVEAYLRAAVSSRAAGQVYNVGSGTEHVVADVVARIVEVSGSTSSILLGTRPYSTHEMWSSSACIGKAEADLGWRPTIELDEGLGRTIDWFQRNSELFEAKYPDRDKAH